MRHSALLIPILLLVSSISCTKSDPNRVSVRVEKADNDSEKEAQRSKTGYFLTSSIDASGECPEGWMKDDASCLYGNPISLEVSGGLAQHVDKHHIDYIGIRAKAPDETTGGGTVEGNTSATNDQDVTEYINLKSAEDIRGFCKTLGPSWDLDVKEEAELVRNSCGLKSAFDQGLPVATLKVLCGEAVDSCRLDISSLIGEPIINEPIISVPVVDEPTDKLSPPLALTDDAKPKAGELSIKFAVHESEAACSSFPDGWAFVEGRCVFTISEAAYLQSAQVQNMLCSLLGEAWSWVDERSACRVVGEKYKAILTTLRDTYGVRNAP